MSASAKLVSHMRQLTRMSPSDVDFAVGLGLDCSPWVKAGYITQDDMLDRNNAYCTTFAQVCNLDDLMDITLIPKSRRKSVGHFTLDVRPA